MSVTDVIIILRWEQSQLSTLFIYQTYSTMATVEYNVGVMNQLWSQTWENCVWLIVCIHGFNKETLLWRNWNVFWKFWWHTEDARDEMLEEELEQELKSKEEEDIDGFLTYLVKIVENPW